MTLTGCTLSEPRHPLLSWITRPLRFAGTGGTAGAAQIVLLVFLTHLGVESVLANIVAFLLAAQVNFVLSLTFTWADRLGDERLGRRWLLFHGSISLMAVVNMLTFLAARTVVPAPPASLLGIAAGAAGNYLLGDHLVFREPDAKLPAGSQGLKAAR
jgi:putative flippase GtrA